MKVLLRITGKEEEEKRKHYEEHISRSSCNWTLSKIKEIEAKHPHAWDDKHILELGARGKYKMETSGPAGRPRATTHALMGDKMNDDVDQVNKLAICAFTLSFKVMHGQKTYLRTREEKV